MAWVSSREREELSPVKKEGEGLKKLWSGLLALQIAAMVTFSNRSLMYLEDLSFPRIQVVAVTASMACSQCRQRVSRLLCRMTSGLIEYTVDVRGKQVILKGETELPDEMKENRRHRLQWFQLVSSFLLFTCCLTTTRKSYGC